MADILSVLAAPDHGAHRQHLCGHHDVLLPAVTSTLTETTGNADVIGGYFLGQR